VLADAIRARLERGPIGLSTSNWRRRDGAFVGTRVGTWLGLMNRWLARRVRDVWRRRWPMFKQTLGARTRGALIRVHDRPPIERGRGYRLRQRMAVCAVDEFAV
jgi:hypothetical protein